MRRVFNEQVPQETGQTTPSRAWCKSMGARSANRTSVAAADVGARFEPANTRLSCAPIPFGHAIFIRLWSISWGYSQDRFSWACGSISLSFRGQSSAVRWHRGVLRDARSRNAEGRLRFPSAAFRDVELNALNYRRSSTSRVAFGLTPRLLLRMEWALIGRGDR